MLDLMEIPWDYFSERRGSKWRCAGARFAHMDRYHTLFAFVMRKGSVESHKLQSRPQPRRSINRLLRTISAPTSTRSDYLEVVQSSVSGGDLIVCVNWLYTGRGFYACGDRENQFYMIGSMGCASSLGLGLA